MSTDTLEHFFPPTEEHFFNEEPNTLEHLRAGVLSEDQIAIIKNPEAHPADKLDAIGKALNHPDFWEYLSQDEYKLDPLSDPNNFDKLFLGASHYAATQEAIQWRLSDPDYLKFLTSFDVQQLSRAKIAEKQALIGQTHADYLLVKSEVDELSTTEGVREWVKQQPPEEIERLSQLPVGERRILFVNKQDALIDDKAHSEQLAAKKAEADVIAVIQKAQIQKAVELKQEKEAADKLLELMNDGGMLNDYLLNLDEPVDIAKLIDGKASPSEIMAQVETKYNSNDFNNHLEALRNDSWIAIEPEVDSSEVWDAALPSWLNKPSGDSLPAEPRPITRPDSLPVNDYAPSTNEAFQGLRLKMGLMAKDASANWNRLPVNAKVAVAGAAVAITLAIGHLGSEVGLLPSGQSGKSSAPLVGEAGPLVKKALRTPSELAKKRFNLSGGAAIPNRYIKSLILKGGEAYAKERVANHIVVFGKSRLENVPDTRDTVSKIDKLALYSLSLLTHRPGVTLSQADDISKQVSDIMLAARQYPGAYDLPAPAVEPGYTFKQELIDQLKEAFGADPGLKHYSAEQQIKLFDMIASVIDNIAPESAHEDVINAFIAELANLHGKLQDAPTTSPDHKQHNKSSAHSGNHELNQLNPRYSLAQIIAAISIIESGQPADPTAVNQFGCKGYMQYCAWTDRAKLYLGDASAPMNTSNQTIVAVKELTEYARKFGSGDAAAAAWLKGPIVAGRIAGLDKNAYNQAMRKFDGNHTTVKRYIANVERHVKTADIDKQLYFLKEVQRLHPHAVDWALLDKEYPLYSHHRLRQVKPFAQQVLNSRIEHHKQGRLAHHRAALRHKRYVSEHPSQHHERSSVTIDGAVNLGMHRAHAYGVQIGTRLYAIKGFPSEGDESDRTSKYYLDGSRGRVIVGAQAAKRVVAMVEAAKNDGHELVAVSSERVFKHQIDLARANPNRNEVAAPGHSGHENPRKSAIDLKLGKHVELDPNNFRPLHPHLPAGPDNPRIAPDSAVWKWMIKNAHKYGYHQYWNEPWHWSLSGN